MSTTSGIIVLDFGGQYTQLIARRVREHHVRSTILPFNVSAEELRKHSPEGIIYSGGPSSVFEEDAPHSDPAILSLGIPVLGICYGQQLISHQLGGAVRPAPKREYGRAHIEVIEKSALFAEVPEQLPVWMSHGDEVEQLPAGFKLTAKTGTTLGAIENAAKKIYAVQFHPEVRHTAHGEQILSNFLFDVCQARPDWVPQAFIDHTVAEVKKQVGEGIAICALSGGVDSTVAATLVHRAIGDRLHCVFVNNGVLRKNEFHAVTTMLRRLGLNLIPVDASERFLTKLAGVSDPEKKRKIIGNEFIHVFEEEAAKLSKEHGHVDWLVQGTLYPDVIESVSVKGPSAVIKSHHNVGGLPETMRMKLIEPLRELFKDEVRRVGVDLGLDPVMIQRQPFPGPGLAVRVLGDITVEKLDLLREADAIVHEEITGAGLYESIWQSFAVLLPVRSVGVMGDQRTYGFTIALRAVGSEDGMTADWVRLPYDVLERISSRIVNEVRGISRVVYDITSKPPGTIEWE